jgi:hypothetical protein
MGLARESTPTKARTNLIRKTPEATSPWLKNTHSLQSGKSSVCLSGKARSSTKFGAFDIDVARFIPFG